MDKNIIIKLTLIDIFPTIEEIENNSNEDISIIFQGLNKFYNLKDLLLSKRDIYINKSMSKNTLIISLVQSINLLAIGFLKIKSGKQWITFSYQNKKKSLSTNLALSLIDCIKINISCEIIYNNIDSYNNINPNNYYDRINFRKQDSQKNVIQNKYSKNSYKINNNKRSNIKQDPTDLKKQGLINSYNCNEKNSFFIIEGDKKLNLKSQGGINTNKNKYTFKTLRQNKPKFDMNFSLSISTSKLPINIPKLEQKKMYSTLRQKFKNHSQTNFSINDKSNKDSEIIPKIEIKEELNVLKKNKTINNLKTNVIHKKEKNYNILKIGEVPKNLRYNNKREKNGIEINHSIFINNNTVKLIKPKNNFNSFISNNTNNSNTTNFFYNIDRNCLYHTTSFNSKSFIKNNGLEISTKSYNKNLKNKILTEKRSGYNDLNINNFSNTFFLNSSNKKLNSYFSDNNLNEKNKTIENIDNITLEDNNYNRLKEDFILLYSDKYVKNIKEDLLKLELELFVEKMTELTKEYHSQLCDKLLEYKIEKNIYKNNLLNYIEINKLYNKLRTVKLKYETKKKSLFENDKISLKKNTELYSINQDEIKLYKLLISENSTSSLNDEDNKIKLKKIINIILSNDMKKNIINTIFLKSQKIMKYLNNNKIMENKPLIRSRIIPKNQQTKYICNFHQNLTNSFIHEFSNEKFENSENNFYFRTNLFSPVIRLKHYKANTIGKNKK